MRRVLLVEDALEVQTIVTATLRDGYTISVAGTAAEAMALIEKQKFDLILLDVVLPDGDGFKLYTQIRSREENRDIPIIFLTGRTEVADKVIGFSLGADDYISKPFEPVELRARVDSKLRKMLTTREREEVLRVYDLRFEIPFQRVHLVQGASESSIDLTPIEFKLLLHLAKHEEKVFTRDQLISVVWGDNISIVDRTVDVHVSNLRKKLAASACMIKPVQKVGYAFCVKDAQARRAQ